MQVVLMIVALIAAGFGAFAHILAGAFAESGKHSETKVALTVALLFSIGALCLAFVAGSL